MGNVLDIPKKKKRSLADRYPLVDRADISDKCKLIPVLFKKEEISYFEILLFHRLMKESYGLPSEIEVIPTDEVREVLGVDKVLLVREGGEGNRVKCVSCEVPGPNIRQASLPPSWSVTRIMKQAVEWRYFISTKSGSILQIGTEERHRRLNVYLVVEIQQKEISDLLIKDSENFINDLLKEAERNNKKGLLNPKLEFEQGQDIGLFLLHNVYLYNYGSAELMLSYANEQEQEILDGLLKYDTRDSSTFEDPTKMAHIDRFMHAVGMYYAATLSYYFMALEGFVNLYYEAFVRDEFRAKDREFHWEKDLNLYSKLRLMPRLCTGFKRKSIEHKSPILCQFKELRNFRNLIFHSKIVDSLKGVCFLEHGFRYVVDIPRTTNHEFPSHKRDLKEEHLQKAKTIVDSIIALLLDAMSNRHRTLVEKYILKETELPFWKDRYGNILMGGSPGISPSKV